MICIGIVVWGWKILFLIHCFMKNSVVMTRTLPKFNWILLMMQEECAKFIENCGCMNLIQVWWWVKNLSSCMSWVCDNNDFWNIIVICSLVDTTFYNKQFSLYAYDIDCMVESFCDRSVVDVCMWYRYCNVVLNTSIYNNKCIWKNTQRFKGQVVQLLNISLEVSVVILIK